MKKTLSIIFMLIVCLCCQAQVENQIFQKYSELKRDAENEMVKKNYKESIEKYNVLLSFMEKNGLSSLMPPIREFVGINWANIAQQLYPEGKYDEAIEDYKTALSYCIKDSKVYRNICSSFGTCLSAKAMSLNVKDKNLKASIRVSSEAESYFGIAGRTEKVVSEQVTRANKMYELGQVEDAKSVLESAINKCRTNNITDETVIRVYAESLGKALSLYGEIEYKEDNFNDAIRHLEEAYTIQTKLGSEQTANITASRLSAIYFSINDSAKERYWSAKVSYIAKRDVATLTDLDSSTDKYIERKEMYIRAANYSYEQKYEKSNETVDSIIRRCEQELNSSYDLGKAYSLRGNNYRLMKEYEAAESSLKTALSHYEKSEVSSVKEQIETWHYLALAYYYWGGHNKETMKASDKYVQMAEEYYGNRHSKTIQAYIERSNIAGFYNLQDLAISDREKVFEMIEMNIESNFAFMTETERTAYWNTYRMETVQMLGYARILKITEGSFIDAIYNQQLLAKGILLNTESSLQRAIDQNINLSFNYQKIRELRKIVLNESNSKDAIDAAILEADKLERTMISEASEVTEFLNFLKIRGIDVKKSLKSGEVAIEFGECPKGRDSVMYSAIILCPEWEHAHFVMLCEARDIVREKENLTNLIWNPILKELEGKSVAKIYFAPTGLLYQLPIESHRMSDGQIMGEKYKMYRMSSTRWIAAGDNSVDGQGAVLYGDLQYDASVEYLADDMRRYAQGKVRSVKVDFGKSRGAISELEPLPATKREIDSIAGIVKNDVRTKRGKEGTEASFKALSGQRKRLIHIATHGFYSEGTDEDVLSNSGLFFAGANNAYMGESLPDGVEDGILTAKEVSDLNFSGLELLVLSACETGLGVVAADGVFGLQRGFKKAGAKSIVMSLWKVDDAATCKLMTEFYKNWLSKNMTKLDALEAAKKSVRETKGWENPKYWAAFILLDGIE